MKKYVPYIILLSIIVLGLVLDLVTKSVFAGFLEYGAKDIVLIPNLLELVYVENDGAAYGILGGKTWFLILLTIGFIIGFVVYFIFSKEKNTLFTTSIALIVSGAIGNLIDRLAFGFVRDFVSINFFSFVFNIADVLITFGVILFAIETIIEMVREIKAKKVKSNNETNDK